ncbi:MAG: ligase-associated DNA damage response exonuclease [Chloroherpetonaceae bacterium]|nr:ligase-associated DNA damage response exonuclease [Chloroherpetonaceae bacterium]
MVTVTTEGLYCKKGNFHIDPWRPVPTAIITHAHADHARPGHTHYFATPTGLRAMQKRLGNISGTAVPYGEKKRFGDVWVSFHPAGHVLGSAQIRIEGKDENGRESVWVVSGDYKRTPDRSCEPFEVVQCDTFISEATFGLPIYQWQNTAELAKEIVDWAKGYNGPSLVFCYAFGKAQRLLAEFALLDTPPIYLHGAAIALSELYRECGYTLAPFSPATLPAGGGRKKQSFGQSIILAPPSTHRSEWMNRFQDPQTAFASGWMAVRGKKKQRGYDRGFAISDHADWNDLVSTILATGAKQVYITHGQSDVLARYLREIHHLSAEPLETLFEGEGE